MSPTGHTHAVTYQAVSVLLQYPDAALHEQLPLVERAIEELPAPYAEPIRRFLAHLRRTSPDRLAADYVDTFDLRRRCSLYLTYYAYGDTRKRGMALLRFKHAYKQAGLHLGDDELPDHLAVVLEYAATADLAGGRRLLTEHRAGLELLRLALVDAGSPYADLVEVVTRTLPSIGARDRDAVLRLAAQGPPGEDVGLEPFAPPEYMPVREGARA